jgi:protein tyrosine phosphatase
MAKSQPGVVVPALIESHHISRCCVSMEIAEPIPEQAVVNIQKSRLGSFWKFTNRNVLAGTVIVLAIATLSWFWILRDRLIVKKWGVVVPGVAYRSGQISQHLVKQTLKDRQIQHIICMTSPDLKDADQQEEIRASRELNADFVYLPLNGRGVGKVEHFTEAVALLAKYIQKREPVLVHCHAGAQRTGGIVAAYRLLVENRSPEFVIRELEAYGWNRRRDQILLDFINENLRKAAEELVATGSLTRVPEELPVLK